MKYLIVVAIIFLSGCYKPPDPDELKSNFVANRASFEELRKLIKEDIRQRNCFEVGLDRVGDYWEYAGLWRTSFDFSREIPISMVLEEEGISEMRYEMYISLISKLGVKRVSFCRNHKEGWTRILIESSGLSVSGSSVSYEIHDDQSIPEDEIEDFHFIAIIPIIDGWFIRYHST